MYDLLLIHLVECSRDLVTDRNLCSISVIAPSWLSGLVNMPGYESAAQDSNPSLGSHLNAHPAIHLSGLVNKWVPRESNCGSPGVTLTLCLGQMGSFPP